MTIYRIPFLKKLLTVNVYEYIQKKLENYVLVMIILKEE